MLDVGVLEPFGDPPLDVTESVPEVSACLESRRALPSVSPRVQGGHRHVQVAGEVRDGEEPIEFIHGRILHRDPVHPLSSRCLLASGGMPCISFQGVRYTTPLGPAGMLTDGELEGF